MFIGVIGFYLRMAAPMVTNLGRLVGILPKVTRTVEVKRTIVTPFAFPVSQVQEKLVTPAAIGQETLQATATPTYQQMQEKMTTIQPGGSVELDSLSSNSEQAFDQTATLIALGTETFRLATIAIGEKYAKSTQMAADVQNSVSSSGLASDTNQKMPTSANRIITQEVFDQRTLFYQACEKSGGHASELNGWLICDSGK